MDLWDQVSIFSFENTEIILAVVLASAILLYSTITILTAVLLAMANTNINVNCPPHATSSNTTTTARRNTAKDIQSHQSLPLLLVILMIICLITVEGVFNPFAFPPANLFNSNNMNILWLLIIQT